VFVDFGLNIAERTNLFRAAGVDVDTESSKQKQWKWKRLENLMRVGRQGFPVRAAGILMWPRSKDTGNS
jgi:hypothetical protein